MTKKISITIVNQRGLHARAAAKLVKTAEQFDADIYIIFNQMSVNAKSIMGLMMLGAKIGNTIEITAQGSKANDALDALKDLIINGFWEDQLIQTNNFIE